MGISIFLRKFLHLITGLLVYFLSFLVSQTKLNLILIFFWVLFSIFEFLRLFSLVKLPFENLWKKLLKDDEKKKLTDSWFYLAGLILAIFFLKIEFFRLLVLILSFSDPLAFLIGNYLGKIKLYKNKTLEGSLVFFAASVIISYNFLGLNWHTLFLPLVLTLVEIFFRRDNFWIPVIGVFYFNFYFF